MNVELFQVDAFADSAFSGNPAAVAMLQEARSDSWMQAVAAEMNLAETAFLLPQADGYSLRWFTPLAEVNLCGHATLASAHLLYERGQLAEDQTARFHTRSGLLTATNHNGWIELDLPALPPRLAEAPPALLQALGLHETPLYTGFDGEDYLVVVADEAIVRGIRPDFEALLATESRGVSVSARSTSADFDFVSRFFAPWVGINEDPVTGSAHCCLGPYWAGELGKSSLVAHQASQRGGTLRVTVAGQRVRLQGQAVTILEGMLLV